ncbi:FliM/FliN family flagellar motor switch protein, partial [Clostridium perfringens]
SLIELDKLAEEPVEVLINGKKIAYGEVVVVDENFGVRITSIISGADRIKSLK